MSLTALNGVRFINQEKYLVCHVDELSHDLKEIIRKRLSTICHGVSKATKGRKTYSYQNTVKSFLERYEKNLPTLRWEWSGNCSRIYSF